jgi:hypothetical protein
LIILINFSILALNKYNFLSIYKLEIYYLFTKKMGQIFEHHKFSIITNIKNKLGKDYRISDYNIKGPKFSKIGYHRNGFLNKKKTEYVKSNINLIFRVQSISKDEVFKIKKSIIDNYPIFINDIFYNILYANTSWLYERNIFRCRYGLLEKDENKDLCNELITKLRIFTLNVNNYIQLKFEKDSNNEQEVQKNELINQINQIFLIMDKNELLYNDESDIVIKEIINTLKFINNPLKDEKLIFEKNQNHISFSNYSSDLVIESYMPKFIIYINLVLLIIIFLTKYFIDYFKKDENYN